MKRYGHPDRLGDVLALIQVLALDPYAHRTESGLQRELQGKPRSADSWRTIGREHPEFFRVNDEEKNPISLVARHVTPPGDGVIGRELDVNFVGKLLSAALDLHDRERSRGAAWRSALPTLVGVVVGGLLTIVGSYVNSHFQFANQVSLQDSQKARDVYSRLMGRRFVTIQLYVSRYEALLYSDYHEARLKTAGTPIGSLDLQEAQRWMRRSEDVVSEIIKSNQALFEDLGTVRTVFADTPQLRAVVDPLWKMPALKRALPPDRTDAAALEKWKEETLVTIQTIVESEYGRRFDDLLSYLEQQHPLH